MTAGKVNFLGEKVGGKAWGKHAEKSTETWIKFWRKPEKLTETWSKIWKNLGKLMIFSQKKLLDALENLGIQQHSEVDFNSKHGDLNVRCLSI